MTTPWGNSIKLPLESFDEMTRRIPGAYTVNLNDNFHILGILSLLFHHQNRIVKMCEQTKRDNWITHHLDDPDPPLSSGSLFSAPFAVILPHLFAPSSPAQTARNIRWKRLSARTVGFGPLESSTLSGAAVLIPPWM